LPSPETYRKYGTAGVPPARRGVIMNEEFALRAHCGRDARGPSALVSQPLENLFDESLSFLNLHRLFVGTTDTQADDHI
jgi:hypothetical protein